MRRAGRLAVLVAATAMIVVPVLSAAAQDVPTSYTLRGVGSAAYTTVDKCCTLIISRVVESGSAYVAGEMTLQRNIVTAAPQWPGELVATAPGTIGFASNGAVPLPELPGYARASTPGNADDRTEVGPAGQVVAGNAAVHSEARSQKADAVLASVASDADGARAESRLTQTLTATAGTTTVTASVADITIGGVLHIGSVRVLASATSGAKGRTELAIANCTVGPVPCRIDESGVHLQDAAPVALADAQRALDGLGAAGTKVFAGGAYPSQGAAVVNGLIVEHALTDPTGDTETTRAVYGYASATAAATPAATSVDLPNLPSMTENAGDPSASAGSEVGGVSPSGGGDLPAAVESSAGTTVAGQPVPSAAPAAQPVLPLRRLALVSRLSSGSVAWMGLGVLLWILAVGSRWVAR